MESAIFFAAALIVAGILIGAGIVCLSINELAVELRRMFNEDEVDT